MSNQFKIALVYLGRRGGIANYTLELARALQIECQLSCHVSTHNVLAAELEQLACPVYLYPTYTDWRSFLVRTMAMRVPRRIAASLRAEDPDLILDTGSGPWTDLVCRMTGQIPWVRVVHDAVLHQDQWKPLLAMQRAILPMKCAALVGVSDFTAAALREQYPASPVIATRHGLIGRATVPDVDGVVRRRKNFLFFGRVEPYKGISVLLDAFELARRSDSELALMICGSGALSIQQRRKIKRLGIKLRDEWIAECEIDSIFAGAGVVILPYLTATQSGVAAIAMVKGIPMIVTNVGGLPEQVVDGINGRVVKAGDAEALATAMVDLASSAQSAKAFALGSHHVGQTRYGWRTIAATLMKDLNALPIVRLRSNLQPKEFCE